MTKAELQGELKKLQRKVSRLEAWKNRHKEGEAELVREKALLSSLMDSIPDWIFFKDTKSRFIRVNQSHAELLGVSDPEAAIGKTDFDFFSKHEAEQFYKEEQDVIRGLKPLVGRVGRTSTTKGIFLWRSETKVPVKDKTGNVIGLVGISRDVTDLKQAEETIRHMAYHDALTGLPNRRLFHEQLKLELTHARRNQTKLALFMLDVDNFKHVNDTLGHDMGDKLLCVVGRRISGILRKSDTLARMGGDEFLLAVPGINRAEDAEKVAGKIGEALNRKVTIDDHNLFVTTSIGAAIYPENGKDIDALIGNADKAMYRAKKMKLGSRSSFAFRGEGNR